MMPNPPDTPPTPIDTTDLRPVAAAQFDSMEAKPAVDDDDVDDDDDDDDDDDNYVIVMRMPPMTVSAGTAFKIGFYGAIGFAIATIVIWLAVLLLFAGAIGSLLHR